MSAIGAIDPAALQSARERLTAQIDERVQDGTLDASDEQALRALLRDQPSAIVDTLVAEARTTADRIRQEFRLARPYTSPALAEPTQANIRAFFRANPPGQLRAHARARELVAAHRTGHVLLDETGLGRALVAELRRASADAKAVILDVFANAHPEGSALRKERGPHLGVDRDEVAQAMFDAMTDEEIRALDLEVANLLYDHLAGGWVGPEPWLIPLLFVEAASRVTVAPSEVPTMRRVAQLLAKRSPRHLAIVLGEAPAGDVGRRFEAMRASPELVAKTLQHLGHSAAVCAGFSDAQLAALPTATLEAFKWQLLVSALDRELLAVQRNRLEHALALRTDTAR